MNFTDAVIEVGQAAVPVVVLVHVGVVVFVIPELCGQNTALLGDPDCEQSPKTPQMQLGVNESGYNKQQFSPG